MCPWVIGGGAVLLLVLVASSGGPPGGAKKINSVPPRRVPNAYPPLGPGNPHRVTSHFGYRINPKTGQGVEGHGGTDVSAPIGTVVFAPLDGVVYATKSEADGNAGGNAVCILANGYRWWFMHLTAPLVSKGVPVTRGQPIGLTGSTGRSTGPHLHITIEDTTARGWKTDPEGVYPEGTFMQTAENRLSGVGDVVPEGTTPLEREHARLAAEATAIANTYNLPRANAQAIVEAADWVGGSGMHLAKVIWAESRMKPTAVNKATNATGLIQFMPATAKALGTSTAALARMSFVQQMEYVRLYLEKVALGEWAGGEEGLLDTQFKMAAAVFYPAWRNKSPATVLPSKVRELNPGIKTMGGYLQFVLAAKTPLDREMAAAGIKVGTLLGEKNPCNWHIEADRVDRGLSSPSREMRLTYLDMDDADVQAECASRVVRRAKSAGRRPAADQAALRSGVRSWYRRH